MNMIGPHDNILHIVLDFWRSADERYDYHALSCGIWEESIRIDWPWNMRMVTEVRYGILLDRK